MDGVVEDFILFLQDSNDVHKIDQKTIKKHIVDAVYHGYYIF